MKKRAMITTIYSARAIKIAITKLSPDAVVCVVEKGYKTLKGKDAETKRQAIKELRDIFGDILKIEILETESLYNIYEIAKDVIKKIDELFKDNEISIHISEGRKPLAFGLSFAAYMRNKHIKGIYYVVAETNNLIKLPLFSFQINKTQKKILEDVRKGVKDIEQLIIKLKKSRSVVYQYVKELRDSGYLLDENKKLELTELGRIILS